MVSDSPVGTLSEAEVRGLISMQIVIESARDAGLEIASPIPAGPGEVLLVYAAAGAAESPLLARRVRVRAFDSGLEAVALAEPALPGEVLALVEWGGLGDGDAVFLLAEKDIGGAKAGYVALHECRARPERWRTLVLG
jgi:hypothetical protein